MRRQTAAGKRRIASSVTLALLLACTALPGATAFASAPPGTSVHDGLVSAGATPLGWPKGAIERLQQAVRQPDLDEMGPEPQLDDVARVDAKAAYRPEHHCDRVPPMSHAEAFAKSAQYIAAERKAAAGQAAAGDPEGAMASLGRALHVLQDCFSHTDLASLPAAERDQALRLLATGTGDVPASLRVTAYQPGADEPGMPEGDPFPHDAHNLDGATASDAADEKLADGRSRFEAARDAAANATREWLAAFMAERTPAERDAMMGVQKESAVPAGILWLGGAMLVAIGVAVASKWRK